MKIILLKDVPHVGRKSEIKEVSDGFGRNFLLPRKLAMIATDRVQHALAAQKEHDEHKRSAEQERYAKIAEKLNTLEVTVKLKTGGKGKAFGSVNAAKIAEHLKDQHHIDLDKEWIHLDTPLKSTGAHGVAVRFPHGVEGKINLLIKSEDD